MTELVEAEVIEELGTEVVPAEPPQANLFHTTDPAEVLKRATDTANALMPVVRKQGLVVKIGSREHLTVEAWQSLGAMLGVTPVCTWTRKLENGWEARVEARTLDGRVIGAAEAECLTAEERWSDSDDFAVRSMAQTRATSKALASVLRFVATLGGAAGTPAEEMDGARQASTQPQRSSTPASAKQRNFLVGQGNRQGLFDKAMLGEGQRRAFVLWTSGGSELTKDGASKLISALKDHPEQGRDELLDAIGKAASEGDELGLKCRALLSDDVPVDMGDADTGVGDPEDIPFS